MWTKLGIDWDQFGAASARDTLNIFAAGSDLFFYLSLRLGTFVAIHRRSQGNLGGGC